MRRSATSTPFSFLLEMLLVLFFFSISAAILVSVYGRCVWINKEDLLTKEALILAQNAIQDPLSLKEGTYEEVIEKQTCQIVIEEQDDGFGTYTVYANEKELFSLSYYKGGEGE